MIVERQRRARVGERIRAGVQELTTTDLIARLRLDARYRSHKNASEGDRVHLQLCSQTTNIMTRIARSTRLARISMNTEVGNSVIPEL